MNQKGLGFTEPFVMTEVSLYVLQSDFLMIWGRFKQEMNPVKFHR